MTFTRRFVAAIFLLNSLALSAQITEERRIGTKFVFCSKSGLSSDLHDCGTPEWYTYVFTGSIAAIRLLPKDQMEVDIIPQEIFAGHPKALMTVTTRQALCGPEVKLGDTWLFYLSEKTGEPITWDLYANQSRPAANSKVEIERLRRLQQMHGFGLLEGTVIRGEDNVSKRIADVRLIARRKSDNSEFLAISDREGNYKFQPLPTGDYLISADSGGMITKAGSVGLESGRCWDLSVHLPSSYAIAVHLRYRDGSPVKRRTVVFFTPGGWSRRDTDESGDVQFDAVSAGKYKVGIEVEDFRGDKPNISSYYPGVQKESEASVLTLTPENQKSEIEFLVP